MKTLPRPTVTAEAECQFCKKTLHLEIDAEYAQLRDPHGLIKMAACDHCGDFRIERSKIEEQIQRTVIAISRAKPANMQAVTDARAALLSELKKILTEQTRKYAVVVCKYLGSRQLIWSEDLADAIYQTPDNWHKLLANYRRVTFNSARHEL